MIDIKELRVGNLIFSKMTGIVEAVEPNDFEMILDDFGDFHPIKITEDWLLKLGFEQSDDDLFELLVIKKHVAEFIKIDLWTRTELGLVFSMEISQGEFPEQVNIDLPHIKYVHQLQNLFFSLTGNDLCF